MRSGNRPGVPTDMRRYRRATEFRLAVAVVIFLTLVASGLVWLFFGRDTAIATLACSLGGALLFGLLYALLGLLGRWAERVWRR